MGFYISNKNKTIPCIKPNTKFSTIGELYDLLEDHGWEEMTVYSRNQWNPALKCSGQCNATVLLVQEYFGGDIIEYPNPNGGTSKACHYFNRIFGVDIDLTYDQYTPSLTTYSTQRKVANFGKNKFTYEKSAYILKRNLWLVL